MYFLFHSNSNCVSRVNSDHFYAVKIATQNQVSTLLLAQNKSFGTQMERLKS